MVTGTVKFSKHHAECQKIHIVCSPSMVSYISHVIFLADVRGVRSVIHKCVAFCGVTIKWHAQNSLSVFQVSCRLSLMSYLTFRVTAKENISAIVMSGRAEDEDGPSTLKCK